VHVLPILCNNWSCTGCALSRGHPEHYYGENLCTGFRLGGSINCPFQKCQLEDWNVATINWIWPNAGACIFQAWGQVTDTSGRSKGKS